MHRRRTISLLQAGVAVLVLLCATSAAAQQDNSLTMLLDVDTDGSAVVAEKLELAAPFSNAITWRMPTDSTSSFGIRRLFVVGLLEVSDGAGNRLNYSTRHFADTLEVLIPVQLLQRNSIRITYEVRNAVQFRDDRDELFWYLGRAWSLPIARIDLTVNVPGQASGETTLQIARWTKKSVVTEHVPMQGGSTSFDVAGPWATGSEPAVDLIFTPGVLQQPSPFRRAEWFLDANPAIVLPIILLPIAFAFRKYKAEPPSLPPLYHPPEDLPPGEAGYLIDGQLDPRDIAAMLLDLARRGFIRIEAGEPDPGVPFAAPDFVLRLLKPMTEWQGAYPYEHTLLFHMFYGGHWTKLSSVSLRFYDVVHNVAELVRAELQRKQLYVDPRKVSAHRLLAAVLLIATLLVVQAGGWLGIAQSKLVLAGVAASLIPLMMLFRRGVPHLPAKAARVLAELHAFQGFLDSVEADRMERVTPDLFEQYLPYAVAFGVEHNWGATFSTISTGPPLWWTAAAAGGIPDFVHLVRGFSLRRPSRAPARIPIPKPPEMPANATSGPQTSS